MRPSSIEKLVWILIYGGLIVFCLGLFAQRQAASLGLVMMLAGSVVAFVGAMLILVRARMKE